MTKPHTDEINNAKKRTRFTPFLLIILVLLAVGSSCGKEKITDTVHPEFIGNWIATEGTNAYIELDIDEGNGSWISQEGLLTKSASGIPKVSIKRNILKLTIKKFKIDSYPVKVGSTWNMILDGITYERY